MSTQDAVLNLHEVALGHLRAGEYARACTAIAELILVLPRGHAAVAGLLTTLAFVQLELGQPARAADVAREALRCAPRLRVARKLLVRAAARAQELGT